MRSPALSLILVDSMRALSIIPFIGLRRTVILGVGIWAPFFTPELSKVFPSADVVFFFSPILTLVRVRRISLFAALTFSFGEGLHSLHLRGHDRHLLGDMLG